MKRLINLSAILALSLVFMTAAFAQDANQNRKMVKAQTMQATGTQSTNFVDENGDGICDSYVEGQTQGLGNGKGYGDGTGLKPQNGSGFGKMNGAGKGLGDGTGTGTGSADGTGQASRKRGGRS